MGKILLLICIVISLNLTAQSQKKELLTLRDSASYVIGISVAENLKQSNLDSLNLDAFILGYTHKQTIDTSIIALTEINTIIEKYQEQKYKEKYAHIIAEGQKFLNENKKKKQITTTASGLQYEILNKGKGVKPSLNDSVTFYYKGIKIDNSIFESTNGKEPISLPLIQNRLIQGMIEVLQYMQEGDTFKVYIPYNLAYGMHGRGQISPFETLIFEIKLVRVIKQADFKYNINEDSIDDFENEEIEIR